MTYHDTPTTTGAGAFALGVLARNRTVSLDTLYADAYLRGLPNPRGLIRTVAYRTPAGRPGTITGIPVGALAAGDVIDTYRAAGLDGMRVLVTGAGCAFGDRPYVIPSGSVVEAITA